MHLIRRCMISIEEVHHALGVGHRQQLNHLQKAHTCAAQGQTGSARGLN
jgi:hypothetical protein